MTFNAAYVANLEARAAAIRSCAELQAFATDALAGLAGLQADMEAQLAKLAPIVALAELSITDLPSVLTFLGDFKTAFLGPYIEPYTVITAQVAQMVANVAAVTAAIEAAAARIGSCEVTL